jgi:hypothetical protein
LVRAIWEAILSIERDLRLEKRRRVLLTATVIGPDGAQPVRVRDLTTAGAGISCDRPPPAGSDVIFKRGNLFVAGRVAWTDRNGAGLQFYRQVELPDLAAAFDP